MSPSAAPPAVRPPKLPPRAATAAALALALASAAGLGLASWSDRDDGQARLSLQELRNFSEAFALIKRRYVDEVDDQTLLQNAIRGMVDGLDPYTAHLDREELKDWEASTSGEFGGLGIVVTKRRDDGPIRVIAPIDDTPAKRAGIRSGDRIVELDGEPVHDLNLHEAVQIMRGKPGTKIVLTLEREGAAEPLEIAITRAVIKVASVRGRMLEPGYGYLRVSNFQARTGADFRAQLRELEDEAGSGGLRGLVLDLRDNPGGLFSAAVEVSDAFLERARRIVTTRGRTADSNAVEDARGGDLAAGVAVVVLINQGSASASEIVAGALQDHGRAALLGTRSFGKGSVQTLLPIDNHNAALKLTTARYYTPSGRSIHDKGIDPDHELEYAPPPDAEEDEPPPDLDEANPADYDNQVRAALELLKTGAPPAPAAQEARAE